MTSIITDNAVDQAITSRQSIRQFLPTAVPRESVVQILDIASRAPSGTNTQPWKVTVLQGAALNGLCDKVCAAHDKLRAHPELASEFTEAFNYYPTNWTSPYIERRRENGWGLYNLLGIGKADKDAMHAQQQRNFRFFDAPVGLIFTIDSTLERGSLIDYGMFLQNIMVSARGHGLHTCPQAAWNRFSKIILPLVGAAKGDMLVCGMALGFADDAAIVNTFRTPRVAAGEFTTWLG